MQDNEAPIVTIVTDMGNGGRSCGRCWEDLDHGNPMVKMPPTCPKCGATFVGSEPPYINRGGSDF